MAIGTPTSLGSVTSASGNTSSIVITTTAAIAAGNLAVVVIQVPSNTLITVSSVSDGTNSYSLAVAKNDGANFDHEIWYKENASAVASGASITATLSGATTGGNGYGAEAFQVGGIVTSSSLDKTATQNAVTATPSVTTAALSQAIEIAIGASFCDGGTRTYTEASGFTNLFNLTPGTALRVGVGYQIVASTSAITYAPTFSGANGTQTLIATFKGIVGPTATGVSGSGQVGTLTPSPSKSLTGVSATSAVGTLKPSPAKPLTGVFGTGQVGSITTTSSVAGVFATGQVGSVRVTLQKTLTGVAGTGQVGSLATPIYKQIIGVTATGEVGEVFPIPPAPVTRAALLIPSENGLPASLWLGNPNNGG